MTYNPGRPVLVIDSWFWKLIQKSKDYTTVYNIYETGFHTLESYYGCNLLSSVLTITRETVEIQCSCYKVMHQEGTLACMSMGQLCALVDEVVLLCEKRWARLSLFTRRPCLFMLKLWMRWPRWNKWRGWVLSCSAVVCLNTAYRNGPPKASKFISWTFVDDSSWSQLELIVVKTDSSGDPESCRKKCFSDHSCNIICIDPYVQYVPNSRDFAKKPQNTLLLTELQN